MRRFLDGVETRVRALGCLLAMALVLVPAVRADDGVPRAVTELQTRFPRLKIHLDTEGVVAAYGAPMTEAATPEEAAERWFADHGGVLGSEARPDLRLRRRSDLGDVATALAFRQFMDGLPVEHGIARVLVLRDGRSRVVYVAGRLARRPKGGFPDDRIDAAAALETIQAMPAYSTLPNWTAPRSVVYQDLDNVRRSRAVRAWKFTGSNADLAEFEAYTFFVSAADGSLAYVRSEVYDGEADDVTGRITGIGSPGTLPDSADNPRAAIPMPGLRVANEFGSSTVTDHNGDYVLTGNGAGPTRIDALFEGPFAVINDTAGPVLEPLSQSIVPPGPADFLFNEEPNEFSVAQVNAFVHTNLTHDFLKDRVPDFTDIDIPLTCNVNILANCNAFFTPIGTSTNFFSEGGGCVNSAFSSVVAHEYGHFVVFSLDLRQGAFGEGFGDSIALLLYDDPVIGRNFFGPGTAVRNIATADKRYPCFGEVHECGQVLAGVWWDIREELAATLGDEDALTTAQRLFADWTQITTGGTGRNSAHPLTAVEVLMVDDDDGDLDNGTPHMAEICNAFVAHNIPCPGTCDEITRFRASCNPSFGDDASFTLRATVTARSAGGSSFTFILDGSDAQSVSLRRFGRGTARWSGLTGGEHEVCIDGCEGFCRLVACEP